MVHLGARRQFQMQARVLTIARALRAPPNNGLNLTRISLRSTRAATSLIR